MSLAKQLTNRIQVINESRKIQESEMSLESIFEDPKRLMNPPKWIIKLLSDKDLVDNTTKYVEVPSLPKAIRDVVEKAADQSSLSDFSLLLTPGDRYSKRIYGAVLKIVGNDYLAIGSESPGSGTGGKFILAKK